MQNIISPLPNTKQSESCSTFSHLRPKTSCEFGAEVMRIKKVIPMIQEISDKLPKIEEKLTKISIKHFEKFQLFVIGCIFAFFPMLHSEIQYRQRFRRKT